jgi:uncharacterized Zn finger protein
MRYYDDYDNYGWRPYVSVAERRHKAEREMQTLKKKGHPVSPVEIKGRVIARTFWGQAWCENLERYSDYANRLPRGRTYVRNGSVVDLQIASGAVTAMVSGSRIYKVTVRVSAVPKARWASISADCAGAIDSLVELLQGRFSKGVMERICERKTGLFPAPAELDFSCSCPDWAEMCKHVAAVFYGIGARLDEQPELLFKLRKVDAQDLIAKAGKGLPLSKRAPASDKVLADAGLSELFGLEMSQSTRETTPAAVTMPGRTGGARRTKKAHAKLAATAAPTKAQARSRQPLKGTKRNSSRAKAGPSARQPRMKRMTKR